LYSNIVVVTNWMTSLSHHCEVTGSSHNCWGIGWLLSSIVDTSSMLYMKYISIPHIKEEIIFKCLHVICFWDAIINTLTVKDHISVHYWVVKVVVIKVSISPKFYSCCISRNPISSEIYHNHWQLNDINFILCETYRIKQMTRTHLKVRVGWKQPMRDSMTRVGLGGRGQ